MSMIEYGNIFRILHTIPIKTFLKIQSNILKLKKNNSDKTIDVLLHGLSISADGELQWLRCMMGKTMSLRYQLLTANDWRLID